MEQFEQRKGDPSIGELIKSFEKSGQYKIVNQKIGETFVTIDEQEVEVPFINMSGVRIIFRKENNEWRLVTTSKDDNDLRVVINGLLNQ